MQAARAPAPTDDGGGLPLLATVIAAQLDLAHRLSAEAAGTVHAEAERVLSRIDQLRALLAEHRRDSAEPSAEPRRAARLAAQSARIDARIEEIEAAAVAILGRGQMQDVLRQVLDGIALLARAASDPGMRPALERAAEGFVSRDQRVAFAAALGLPPPPEDEAMLELF